MRRLSFLLLVFCLGILFATNANSWELCETSLETLNVAGEIAFTSSLCNCLYVDIIIPQITPTNPAVVIDSEVFTKAARHRETNQSRRKEFPVNSYDYPKKMSGKSPFTIRFSLLRVFTGKKT